jgi:hypothetical protein
MNIIKLLAIVLFLFLRVGGAFAQSCPMTLNTTFPNGEKGCLTDLPLAKVIDKSWNRPISDVAKFAAYYSIAVSSTCNYIAIGVSSRSVPSYAKEDADRLSLGSCPSRCNCALIVENGKILLSKELASVVAANTNNIDAFHNSEKKSTADSSNLASIEKLKLEAERELAKQRELEAAQEAENKRLAEAKRKHELDVQAQRERELEISRQRAAEALKLAEAQKIKDAAARAKIEAETRERDRLLAIAIEKEKSKAQEIENLKMLAEAESKDKEKQLLAALEAQKQKAAQAKQEAEKLALIASNEVSERQKDRELLLQLSAELARLKAEQQRSSQTVAVNQPSNSTNKPEPAKQIPIIANRKALVIGNDGYKFVSKLANAKEDAIAISENLTKVGYKVTLKLDQSEKEMKASLRNFKSQVEAGDEVAFFYAGHGVQLSNTNYLLPVDVAGEGEEQIKDEAISLQRILDDMSDKKVKFTLAMIDACRDNPFKSSGRSIGGGARGLAPTTAATGQMVVFSAGTGQQALDKLGPNDKDKNGLFTRLFIKEMQKSGITIDQLVRNVRNEVVSTAKSIGHDQVPAIYDQVVGDFYFRK